MPTLYSVVNETGNRNRILEMCKFRFWLVHWIDPRLFITGQLASAIQQLKAAYTPLSSMTPFTF